MAFGTSNTIRNLLQITPASNEYKNMRLYKLTRLDCYKLYTGNTRLLIHISYKEHTHHMRNKEDSYHTTHILMDMNT
jgi:hypothetical protein